ncbi:MAG: AMP-binding protein [Bryobacteraceae bacterium]|nr:AMP-binding protein [Bryobacteraceae bacterium]
MKTDLFGWLTERAQAHPEAPALLASGRRTLSYAGLAAFVSRLAGALTADGYERRDRMAIVIPAGPEAATAFLATSSFAVAAPLNPSLREEDFEFYLSDLRIKGLLTHDPSHPSAQAARNLGIRVHLVRPLTQEGAGMFELDSLSPSEDGFRIRREPSETALLLHTSGTTARPKIVPLTQANLLASARNVAASLQLAPADRCLNIMPLFHIHGLVASLLASLHAGGSVVCAPVFQAPRFFDWMREFLPTWYTAVPTMHQSILARAAKERNGILDRPLRFLRSCSAPLAPALLAQLEDCFEAPVIEAYGMTEAAHQIASNPLPPRAHKPGTVGLPTGPEVAIMDENGRLLEPGMEGEIVIRGDNVTPGYLDNPAANQQAFRDGWFRTGDLGAFDQDGYLRITGRLKEMINHGGEKIAPREVDEALLHHPAVAQAVAFAIPDPRLGEDVGAAVVLKDGMQVSAADLRRFAADHLADFKIPSEIVFVPDIPKGPTGKVQRIGLAERLGIRGRQERDRGPARPPFEPPATETEKLLAALWSEVLRVEAVGVTEDFLSLGGDSLLAAQLAARIRSRLNVELRIVDLLDASTVRGQAQRIERARSENSTEPDEAGSRALP